MKAAIYIRVGKKEQLDYAPTNNKPIHEHKNKKNKDQKQFLARSCFLFAERREKYDYP